MDTDSSHLLIAGIIVALFLGFVFTTFVHYIQPHTQPQGLKSKNDYIFSLITITLTFTLGLMVVVLYDSLSIVATRVVVAGYIAFLGVLLLVSASLSWLISRYHKGILSSGFLGFMNHKTPKLIKGEMRSVSMLDNLQ